MKKLLDFCKRLSVITLVLIMMVNSVNVVAYALTEKAQGEISFESEYENPVFWDNDERVANHEFEGYYENPVKLDAPQITESMRKASEIIRDNMVNRRESFSVEFDSTATDFNYLVNEVVRLATSEELANAPNAGDYLAYQYRGYRFSGTARVEDGLYKYTVNVNTAYYTTASQEKKVDEAVAKALKEMKVDKLGDYEKVKAIYDFICKTCDYSNDQSPNNFIKFSAYGAIINGSAVCQGYSTLLYRMLKEAGIDSRIITSTSHAWNIVKIENCYYNVDATWDDNYYDRGSSYVYFLTCNEHFNGHERENQFKTDAFNQAYKMTTDCYYHKFPLMGRLATDKCANHEYVLVKNENPTCTKDGLKHYTCKWCNAQKKVIIKAPGHTEVVDKEIKPTYAKSGKTKGSHCAVCNAVIVKQKEIPKLTVSKVTIKSVTALSGGFKLMWGKQANVDGYEIQYSTAKGFTAKATKTAVVKKNKTTQKTINKLAKNKKYFIRIRAYKVFNGKKYYSPWSNIKNVTTKK